MRFATIATWAGPRVVVQSGAHFIDLHATDANLPGNLRQLLEMGLQGIQAAQAAVSRADAVKHPVETAVYHAPVVDPRKVICIGLNYRDHALESGVPIPKEPVVFSKYATALTGHVQPIVLPKVSAEVDYEAELVVIVGKRGRHLTEAQAMDHVAGYAVGHDVSARDWQLQKDGKQWMLGKSFDTFAPVGPVMVTRDEIPDPHKLPICLRLNGKTMQQSNTEQMIFSVGAVLAYLSQVFTLEPGDVIFTGTPPGVGGARKPPVYLKGGDIVEVEIEGLGTLRNPVTQDQ